MNHKFNSLEICIHLFAIGRPHASLQANEPTHLTNYNSGTTTLPSGASSSSHSKSSQSRSSGSGMPVEICVSTHAKSTVSSRISTGWSARQFGSSLS